MQRTSRQTEALLAVDLFLFHLAVAGLGLASVWISRLLRRRAGTPRAQSSDMLSGETLPGETLAGKAQAGEVLAGGRAGWWDMTVASLRAALAASALTPLLLWGVVLIAGSPVGIESAVAPSADAPVDDLADPLMKQLAGSAVIMVITFAIALVVAAPLGISVAVSAYVVMADWDRRSLPLLVVFGAASGAMLGLAMALPMFAVIGGVAGGVGGYVFAETLKVRDAARGAPW